MNLLSLLLTALLSKEAVSALSRKTGISQEMIRKLLPLAVPILIKFLTQNASSSKGAESLFGALGQHTNKKPMADQIKDADEVDGAKIIQHILGKSSDAIVKELAKRSGLKKKDVTMLLSLIAPALLSGLSASASSTAQSSAVHGSSTDLSPLAQLFGASPVQELPSSSQGALGILGPLLNSSQSQSSHQAQNSAPLGMLGSLLSMAAGTEQAPQGLAVPQENTIDGSDLLKILSALYKKK